jgi:O-antigen/teichoic acid export membrane protein
MSMLGPGARSILSNATYLFGSQVATALLRGVYVVVLARALGPENFGILNYALAWYLLFISLTYLGLDAYLVQRISTDRSSAPLVLRQTLMIRAGAAVVVAVGSCVIAMAVESVREVWLLSGIFAVALVGRALWMWAVSAFTAFERTQLALRGEVIFRPMEIGAALLILMWQPHLHWLAASHALFWCVQGGFGVYTVARHLSPFPGGTRLRSAMQLLAKTLPAGTYIIVIAVFMQAPIVLMRLIERDEFRLGQFALAYQTCMYLLVVPYLIASVMLPVVSRAATRGDGRDIALVGLLVRATCIGGALLVIVLAPAIPPLTLAVFGPRYSHAGELLQAALWLAIPFAAVNFILSLFFARHAYASIGIHATLGALLMLATMIPAVHFAGHTGAVLSVGAGLSVWLLLMILSTRMQMPAYDRLRSLGALAAVLAALMVQSFTAHSGGFVQMGAAVAALVIATTVFRALDGRDAQIFSYALSGALPGAPDATRPGSGRKS